jgi:hypothetical protein
LAGVARRIAKEITWGLKTRTAKVALKNPGAAMLMDQL